MKPILFLLLLFFVFTPVFAQTTWFVRAGASPVGADASSWESATPYLQDALEAAQSGDAIWIAEGTYHPSSTGDRYISFNLKNNVRLYGGFAGTETGIDQRDWDAHPTILSGDVGTPGLATDNSFCILYAARTSINTRIDGVIFEGGHANHPDNVNVLFFELGHSGSAIYLNGQNPGNFAYLTIENCTFRDNWSDFYGAVYANGRNGGKCAVLVDNCVFEGNKCGGIGGGLAIDNDATQIQPVQISRSAFHDNYAFNRGGGLLLSHHADVTLQDCSFMRDSIRFHAGGALSIEGDFVNAHYRLNNCTFDQNRVGPGAVGGAIVIEPNYSDLRLTMQDCVISRHNAPDAIWHPASFGTFQGMYRNCIFRENTVANLIYHQTIGITGEQRFVNCLFYKNSGAEILDYFDNNDQVTHRLFNCIVVKASGLPVVSGYPDVIFKHCMVSQATCAGLGVNAVCGPGMIFGADPVFTDAANGDFHVRPCSPAINAGDNGAVAGLATDRAGNPRILDDTVDLGPYEHDLFLATRVVTPVSCPGSRDGAVEFGGYHCPPLTLSWTKGGETGVGTDSLAAGTYVFRFSDAAGHTATDTVLIPSLPPMDIQSIITDVSCFGLSDGAAGINVSGGTPPYGIAWANGNTSGFLYNLPAGAYPVTVTDANGCTATEAIVVDDPGLIQVFYTVTPASAPGQPDGQIEIDSVIGCMGPFPWSSPNLSNLMPGSYTLTVTDPCGCLLLLSIPVGVATGAGGVDSPDFSVRLSPNPALPGHSLRLEWDAGLVESILMHDAAGRFVQQVVVPPGARQVDIPAPAVAGVYWLTVRNGNRGRILQAVVR